MIEKVREFGGFPGHVARTLVRLAPLVAVAVALHAAWLVGLFGLWNLEMARLQNSADAAALAGASSFLTGVPGTIALPLARDRALRIAEANNPRGFAQRVAVEVGTFDPEARAFVHAIPQTEQIDAVRVTIRRDGVLGSLGQLLFVDWLHWSRSSTATAVAEGAPARRDRTTLAKPMRLVE